MNSPRPVPARRRSSLPLLGLILAACGGGGLRGSYTPSDGAGFFQQLTFVSGDKVAITFMGRTAQIAYRVKGKQLTIINPNAGETQVFTIDDAGCLDAGGLVGKYCRSGGIPVGVPRRDLAGTWEARAPGGSFRLTFAGDNRVQLTVADDGGAPQTDEARYEVSGNQVTITGSSGNALQLTRKGESLEGTFGSLTMTFTPR